VNICYSMNFDSNYGELNSREKVGWNELTYLEGMVEFFFLEYANIFLRNYRHHIPSKRNVQILTM